MEIISNSKQIFIVNKIKHKPLLFDYIFPFIEKRPLTFTYLIGNDMILKEKIIPILESISRNNKLSKTINDNMYKFLLCRFLYEINLQKILKELKENMIKESNYFNPFQTRFFNHWTSNDPIKNNNCILDYLYKLLIQKLKKKVNSIINIDIKYSKNLNDIYKNKYFGNYIIDYLNIQKEMLLFHLPFNIREEKSLEMINEDDEDEEDEEEFLWNKKNIYGDSYYINNLNKNTNQKIHLVYNIDKIKTNQNLLQIEYSNIHKLYFFLAERNKKKTEDNKNIYQTINKCFESIKHKENIEEIYFSNAFFNQEKNDFLYEKLIFETVLENLIKNEQISYNQFKSLKKIEFNDDKVTNNIKRFKLRYNLNKIFGFNIWSKIIIINYKEIENIYINKTEEKNIINKLFSFDNDTTNLKILLIDFEYNSPQQNIFYNFCKTYLNNNSNINMLIFCKIGNLNCDENFYNNNAKIILPNLIQIYYEKDIEEKKNNNVGILKFIKRLFDINKFFIYEGYDDKNNIIYLNIALHSIEEEELLRIFLYENKISLFNLIKEDIQIKYNKNKNHLIINHINNKLKIQEKNSFNKPICFFRNIIRGLVNLNKLTINGFDYSFYNLINSNIISLSINSLNEFGSKNFNHINTSNSQDFENDWKTFTSFDYIKLFNNLKYLTISGNLQFLKEIIIHSQQNKNLKKIKLYKEYNFKNNLKDELNKVKKMKDITIEIINTNLHNVKYEDEDNIEEENNSIIQNKIKYKKNNIIQNLNWLNSFDSQILKNIDINYIAKIINLFSKIYPNKIIYPYNFSLLKRFTISNINKEKKNENLLNDFKEKKNLMIIATKFFYPKIFYGCYNIKNLNNNEGIIFDNSNQKFYEISQITNISLTIDIDYFKNSFFILNGTTFSRGDICLGHESNCVEVFELL